MWWNKHFNKWIDICIENPLKTWKKVKQYFKKPKLSINFFSHPMYNCPFASFKNIAKILEIRASDVGWKEKYDSPRHERPPYIWVCLFKRFGFSFNWHIWYQDEYGKTHSGDDFYWEYLLDYLYFNKNLNHYDIWVQNSELYKEYKYIIPVVAMSLNENGIKKLKNG